MKLTLLDNGRFIIAPRDARELAGDGGLPVAGRELLVEHDGKSWWLARTIHGGRQVWTIRETGWRRRNGLAVLGSDDARRGGPAA